MKTFSMDLLILKYTILLINLNQTVPVFQFNESNKTKAIIIMNIKIIFQLFHKVRSEVERK